MSNVSDPRPAPCASPNGSSPSIDLRSLPGYTSSRLAFYGMAEQALAGVQFDQQGARALVSRISELMLSIEQDVEPKLPPRRLKKSEEMLFTLPAKPYKKDGSLSASMLKWLEKHPGIAELDLTSTMIKWRDETFPIVGGFQLPATMPMKMANQEDIKDFLISSGWRPSLFNVKKDARGKPVRDERGKLINTTPKMQEQGRLCPNLEALEGPLAKQIVRWLSLRNRKSVVEGWLGNERLAFDGRLSAGAVGFTPTYRWKHHTVVNVPKADPNVLLGTEMRQLITARPGRTLVGYDASGIEARAEAHWCYQFPNGKEYAATLVEKDVHIETVRSVFYEKVAHLDGTDRWNKDDPEMKPWRNKAKGVKYSIGFGAGAVKVASILGISKSEAEDVLERYWAGAQPAADLKKKLTQFWETTGEKKWIKGVDGRRIRTRSEHALINSLFQSTGAIVMEYADLFMTKWLGGWTTDDEGYPCFRYKGYTIYRVIQAHDEQMYDTPLEIADEIGKMGVRSIEESGRYLKMNVPLAGAYGVHTDWTLH